jgi:carboxyl-terminal processing protease
LCRINNILETSGGFEVKLQNDFLNIFCTYFDPHSNYFFLDEKMAFMSALSTSSLSLGLELGMNEKEEIVVEEIVPGGPAAQSQKIEKEDIIVKVSDKAGYEYSVSCTSLEVIGDIIFSEANKEIKFTIRKKNGTLVDLVLNKQVMKATENSVYSFIAEKKTRVGYIRIPSFYSDFEGRSHHGCAEDVAKEITKLRNDNVDGIVLDLQGNGGGSMDEAIKLAGMFVDNGPISIAVNNQNKQEILRDSDRGMAYNGPLVVMINGASASASEFFAAAMQDYNRALIVGATSLGKASIQVIQPLDEKQEEFVKVTIQKFYRVTGESSQIKGIVPDIFMPVIYDSIMPREKSYKNALAHDFIDLKARFKKYEQDYSSVIARSIERVKSSARFRDLKDIDEKITNVYNNPIPSVSLKLDDVYNMFKDIDVLWKRVKLQGETHSGFKISNNSYESRRIGSDDLLRQINSDKIKDVKSNPYLEEAFNIIRDCKTLIGGWIYTGN